MLAVSDTAAAGRTCGGDAAKDKAAVHRVGSASSSGATRPAAGVVNADSSSWRAYTGQTLEGWLGYGRLGAIHPDDRVHAEQQWRKAVAARGLVDAESRLRAPDGNWRWTNVRAAPVLDEVGEIQKWLGMNIDIDDRKRTEAELARLYAEMERQVAEATAELKDVRDFLRAVFAASKDMIQIFEAIRDANGEIVDFRWLLNNHTSERHYGNVRGESLLTHNPGVIEEGIFDAFKRVTETGMPERAERHYVHEQFDGWFYQSIVKLNDGVATTTKDMSDWKLALSRSCAAAASSCSRCLA